MHYEGQFLRVVVMFRRKREGFVEDRRKLSVDFAGLCAFVSEYDGSKGFKFDLLALHEWV